METTFPKGDVRRLLKVALAMSELEKPTLNRLAAETGHHKQTILDDMKRLQAQLGMTVEKRGSEYWLTDWGPAIAEEGVKKLLLGQSN